MPSKTYSQKYLKRRTFGYTNLFNLSSAVAKLLLKAVRNKELGRGSLLFEKLKLKLNFRYFHLKSYLKKQVLRNKYCNWRNCHCNYDVCFFWSCGKTFFFLFCNLLFYQILRNSKTFRHFAQKKPVSALQKAPNRRSSKILEISLPFPKQNYKINWYFVKKCNFFIKVCPFSNTEDF